MKIDAGLSILREMSRNQQSLKESHRRLASGSRLSAKNDPASSALSEKLQSQIREYEKANKNISYTQSSLNAKEGALSEMNSNLQRLRELAVQSANGSLSDTERAHLQNEFDQLVQNIDSIAARSNLTLEIQDIGIAAQDSAEDALEAIDHALSQVNSLSSKLGAQSNVLEHTSSANAIQAENLTRANSQLSDLDYAEEMSELHRLKFIQNAQIQTLRTQLEAEKKAQSSLLKKL